MFSAEASLIICFCHFHTSPDVWPELATVRCIQSSPRSKTKCKDHDLCMMMKSSNMLHILI